MDLAVPAESAAERLDLFLRTHCPQHSRSSIQALIKAGAIRVNGKETRPAYLVQPGDEIAIEMPEPEPVNRAARATPPVHRVRRRRPARRQQGGRHDRTSGSGRDRRHPRQRIIAPLPRSVGHQWRTPTGNRPSARQGNQRLAARGQARRRPPDGLPHSLQARQIERCYARPRMGRDAGGRWAGSKPRSAAIPRTARKMAAIADGRSRGHQLQASPSAVPFTNLGRSASLETGRTHQIRVHLAHIGHPVFGDPVYGGRDQARGVRPEYRRQANWMLSLIKRQALHAKKLRFAHPTSGEMMEFTAPLPEDSASRIRGGADGRANSTHDNPRQPT